ncbi:MAG: hypothetical protein Q4B09_11220 [Lachnospiraceae bacterium]|nr:hypothetical protein [Lachnospiraceae bacterium]
MGNRVFRIRPFLMAVCRRGWKKMLVLALLLAFAMGGYKASTLWPQYKGAAAAEAEESENQVQEEAAAEDSDETSDYLNKKKSTADYSQNMKQINEQIANRSEYLNNSLVARIDAYHEGRSVVDLTVSSDAFEAEKSIAVPTDDSSDGGSSVLSAEESRIVDITRAYAQFVRYGIDWTALMEEFDTSEQYLNEIIKVTRDTQVLNRIEIRVIYPTDQGAARILDEIIRQIEEKQAEISEQIEEHTLTFSNRETAYVIDAEIYNYFTGRINDINTLISGRSTFNSTTAALGSSTPVVRKTISGKRVLKSTVKYAVVGFAGGIVLYLLAGVLLLICAGTAVSGEDFNRAYGFRKLAAVPLPETEKLRGITSLFAGEELAYLSSRNRETAYQIAAENIGELSKGMKSLVLAGDQDQAFLQQMAEQLQKELAANGQELSCIAIGDPTSSPAALRRLREADGVVMTANIGASTYGKTDRITEAVDTYKKDVIGSIVIA